MRKNLLYLVLFLIQLSLFQACSDDDDFKPSIIDMTEEIPTELDTWLSDNYTSPHNIAILYRWNDFEANQEYTLVPPKEDKVQPFLRMIKRIWIMPYLEGPGKVFFNQNCPKQIMLVGSAGYNPEGSFLMGEAEGGHKITIYDVNNSDPTDVSLSSTALYELIWKYAHNFHHEFAHVLHQKVEYTDAFEAISSGDYTSSWASVNPWNKGFITSYAALDADEDFAEMISIYITSTAETWAKYMSNYDAEEILPKMQEKEKIVREYLKKEWNINIDDLRASVLQAMDDVMNKNF